MTIGALLLAAGESRRMGATKQLLPIEREPMLSLSLKNLSDAGISEIVVVLGHDSENIIKTLRLQEKNVRIAINSDYRRGMSSSIAAGLKMLSPGSSGVLIALGDQPLVKPATISALIQRFISSEKGIAIASYRGRRGHPVIFSSTYFIELLSLSGEVGARAIIHGNPDDIAYLESDDGAILMDIDTPSDLIEVRRRFT
jgi:molybdenum cofactor cytidylyltransferase